MGSESAASEEARPGEDVPLDAGEVLDGRYRVVDVLGTGGVGIVYRAEHLGLKREVAVKVLRKSFVEHVSLRPRFDREARAMAAMSHPNIVSVMDYGVTSGSPYIVMELLEGRTLRELMNVGPVPEAEALRIARTLLRGLGYAHARGLVHRDVKPGNVFLQSLDAQGEHVKLLDFGFAKIQAGSELTTGSMISAVDETFGTPAYMAPEQAMGDHLDHRADLYSVGILMFEMLAGDKPFVGDLHEIVKGHLAAPVPALGEYRPDVHVRPPLMDLLRTAMAKNPTDRFASADDMVGAIEELPRDSLVPMPAWREEVARREASDADEAARIARSEPPPPLAKTESNRAQLAAFIGVVAAIALVGFAIVVASEERTRGGEPAESDERAALVAQADETEARAAVEARATVEADERAVARAEAEATEVREAEAAAATAVAQSETSEEESEVVRVEDPWDAHPHVPLLEDIRETIDSGRTPAPRAVRQLRSYSRGNRADPRPHVLLARIFHARHWWSDALSRYALAYEVDPRIADDPVMHDDLIDLAANPNVEREARGLVTAIYGADEVPVIIPDP